MSCEDFKKSTCSSLLGPRWPWHAWEHGDICKMMFHSTQKLPFPCASQPHSCCSPFLPWQFGGVLAGQGALWPVILGQQPHEAKLVTMAAKPQPFGHSFFPLSSHTGGAMEHRDPLKCCCHLTSALSLPWGVGHGAVYCFRTEEEVCSRLVELASHPQDRSSPPPP